MGEGKAMTWTHIHCHFPTFENEEAEHAYMQEKLAEQATKEAEREQFIVTEQRAYPPHELTAREKRRKTPPPTHFWVARLVDDWREGTGDTEERAIGDLWLMYSHEIIERIKR
jgi:hypothetical protein